MRLGQVGRRAISPPRLSHAVARLLPRPAYLALDAGDGLLLAASPRLFWFVDRVWAPHPIFGLLELGAAVLTRRRAECAQHLARG